MFGSDESELFIKEIGRLNLFMGDITAVYDSCWEIPEE